MTRLHETIETMLPIETSFDFIADFANAAKWDPGVVTSERLDAGPVGVGAVYRLGIRLGGRVAPMEYRISVFDRPSRVVLVGEGSGVSATDDIRFGPVGPATRIDYTADIRLAGLLRFAQPFLSGAFTKLARNAAVGMRRALDARAEPDPLPKP